jgi:plasmid stabilization system protein ParE
VRGLVFTAAAEADLADIARHITRDSGYLAVGRDFIAKLRNRCGRLASLPGILGTARPELRADIRSVSEQGYVILFRYLPDQVEIVRIIEGHRDVAAQFDPPQSH